MTLKNLISKQKVPNLVRKRIEFHKKFGVQNRFEVRIKKSLVRFSEGPPLLKITKMYKNICYEQF